MFDNDFTPPPLPPTRTYRVFTNVEGDAFEVEAHNLTVEDGVLCAYLIIAFTPEGPAVALREAWAPGVWRYMVEVSAPMTKKSLILQ